MNAIKHIHKEVKQKA